MYRPTTLRLITTAILFAFLTVSAAAQNPHERLMERAHPTPMVDVSYDFAAPKLPFVQGEETFNSLFTNVNMIIAEDDPLPVQNESSIAINPLDPNNLIGSAVDYRNNSTTKAYFSKDGGKTWRNVDLGRARTGWRSSNDPSVCFDHTGRGFLCYGGFNRQGQAQFGENGVFVSITTDGGETWATKHVAVIIHTGQQTADSSFEDKYYIHADTATNSPFRGRLYIPWKRVINSDSSTGIVIARSTDAGLTWLEPVAVSDRFPGTSEDTTFGQSFPLARTGPDGSVHLVWNSGTESSVRYSRSTDGGDTWTSPRILHTYEPFGEKSEVAGQVNSRVKGVVRAEAYPTLSIDNTGGPRNGNLYLVWSADRIPNVYFSMSEDNGETWSDPQIVHSDTSNDQFWPWLALDPTNGELAVMYFDSREDDENILVNCYVSYSSDGGATWTDRRAGDDINDLRRNPFTGNTFAGDYSGCDFYGGRVYPSWVDMRHTTELNASDNDVYTAVVKVRAPSAPETMSATTLPEVPNSIDVSWSEVATRSFGQPLAAEDANYILSREGTEIATLPLSQTSYRDTGLTAHEEYRYTLIVVDDTDTSAERAASAFAAGSRLPGVPTIHSVSGKENGELTIEATMPTRRFDGTTKLVNLAGVLIRANDYEETVAVAASDTGSTLTFTIQPNADGWYNVSLLAVDTEDHRSPTSDTLITFTGSMLWSQETFDSMPAYWVRSGDWDRTDAFAFSQPASFTETPDGPYGRSHRDTVLLYPRVLDRTPLRMSWQVVAFIEQTDTMKLESAPSLDGPWTRLAWWNSSQDDRWTDTTKGDDAWRWGSTLLEGNAGDTLFLRLVFRSNVVRHSDGFYIDDITIDNLTSVSETSIVRGIFPQPAATHLNVGLNSDSPITSCTVVSMNGETMQASWYQSGSTLIVNVRDFGSGIYAIALSTSNSIERRVFNILR